MFLAMSPEIFVWHLDIMLEDRADLEYKTTMGTWILENALAKTHVHLSDSLSARPASPTYVPDPFLTAQASWMAFAIRLT